MYLKPLSRGQDLYLAQDPKSFPFCPLSQMKLCGDGLFNPCAFYVAFKRGFGLRSDLRDFVMAQESYFANHNTYATSLHALGELYAPSPGVTLVVLTSSNTGHGEIAVDERVPGLVCSMYVGNSPPPVGKGEEGELVCRGP